MCDMPHTAAVHLLGRRGWTSHSVDHRVMENMPKLSRSSFAVAQPHTNPSLRNYMAKPHRFALCKQDIPETPYTSGTDRNRLCRYCDYMTGELDPWRCCSTWDKIIPQHRKEVENPFADLTQVKTHSCSCATVVWKSRRRCVLLDSWLVLVIKWAAHLLMWSFKTYRVYFQVSEAWECQAECIVCKTSRDGSMWSKVKHV